MMTRSPDKSFKNVVNIANIYNKHLFNSFRYKNKDSLNVNNNKTFSIYQLNNNDNNDINNNKNDGNNNNINIFLTPYRHINQREGTMGCILHMSQTFFNNISYLLALQL